MTWKIGCGVILLGFVVSLGSCGLFGKALSRLEGQRSIESRAMQSGNEAWFGVFTVDEGASVRVEFEATLLLTEDDLAQADSSSAMLHASLPMVFSVDGPDGVELTRGAKSATGTEILSAANHPSRRDTPRSFTARVGTDAFTTTSAGEHVALVEADDVDADGRTVESIRMNVFDRVPTDVGGLAIGGIASLLLGPFIAFAGVVVFAVGLLLRQKKESA